MNKKFTKVVSTAVAALALLGIGGSSVNYMTEQTVHASVVKKYHLHAYVIPKRFRGTWHAKYQHKNLTMHITKRHIKGPWDKSNMTTYKFNSNVPCIKGVYIVSKWEHNGIQYSVPQTCAGGAIKRKGSKLIYHQLLDNIVFHRSHH